MKYLVDTDVVVNQLRGKTKLKEKIVEDGIAISIITFGELLYGAHKSADKEKSLTVLHEFISDFKINILDLTQEIMNAYAKTKVLLEEKGKKLDEFDLLIGATAIVHSLPFVTLNLSHFERIPNLHIVKNHS